MSAAASRSAVPLACVTCALTTSPCRLSVSTCPIFGRFLHSTLTPHAPMTSAGGISTACWPSFSVRTGLPPFAELHAASRHHHRAGQRLGQRMGDMRALNRRGGDNRTRTRACEWTRTLVGVELSRGVPRNGAISTTHSSRNNSVRSTLTRKSACSGNRST